MFADERENRSQIIQCRITPSEAQLLAAHCEREEIKISDVLRRGLDLYLAQLEPASKASAGSGSKESGSKRRPSASTAKVKATGKRSPSKSQ